MLFCNVGWMERYKGLHGDAIVNGGDYVQQNKTGHEICNFVPYGGRVYGYVQTPGIAIERLGAKKGAEQIQDVTVIWTATQPGGGRRVIGWYKNATVYRENKKIPSRSTTHEKNKIRWYRITAKREDALLLPVDERTIPIPNGKGGMTRNSLWYADSDQGKEFVKTLEQTITQYGNERASPPKKTKKGRTNQDQEQKVRIEKIAIAECQEYYEKIGYKVKSVEKDNYGWDLEATQSKNRLRIEVKGLSASVLAIELTPNEYVAFGAKRPDYRLAVVVDALTKPKLLICRYSVPSRRWLINDQGDGLDIKKRIGASIKCR